MAVHQAYSPARDESLEDLAVGVGSVLSPRSSAWLRDLTTRDGSDGS
jgi:hypothetical protein